MVLALPVLNAIPFFGLPSWFSPPDWGKVIFFRIIVSALLFLFTCQMLSDKSFAGQIISKLRSVYVYFWGLAGIFSVFLLSVVFSQDPFYSFFGDPRRAGGFLNFSFYIIFCILFFLIIEKKHWQKIWDFTILVGIMVSLMAIFQHYNILNKIFEAQARPGSTLGNSVLLGIYLLFLIFISFVFFLKEKTGKRKAFYLLSFLLFLFVVVLTQSRATFLGLSAGFGFFFLFFSRKLFSENRRKLIIFSKVAFLALTLLAIFFVYYVNVNKNIPFLNGDNFIQKTVKGVLPRLSINLIKEDPRFSVWQVAFFAIKEKPVFGWGPGNFSVAFDKHYDPSLPHINTDWGSWYDKAHNFVFDTAVESGILGLAVYLLFFGFLFYRMHKIKNNDPKNYLIYHGIQATFIGYAVNNLFSFDSFSNYLILFLLVAFSLHLILSNTAEKTLMATQNNAKIKKNPYKSVIIYVLICVLIIFLWQYNIKPFYVNAELNNALELKDCQKTLPKIESLLSSGTYLNHYLVIKYANTVNECLASGSVAQNIEMVEKAVVILENTAKIRPTYTRDWITLGIYTNFLMQNQKDPGEINELKNKANSYFQKASDLSPKRQEVFVESLKTYYLIKDYKQAAAIAQKCIDLSETMGECWWMKGLSNIYLNNIDEAKENFKKAGENRYLTDSPSSLAQLTQAYLEIKNYEELILIHQKLVASNPKNIQYLATLAYNYKIMGDYKMARETCQKILELDKTPETKKMVDEFLQTLR